MWPQWLQLTVAIGSYAVLTLAGDCSDPLNCRDGQTGETRARCIRIEPRAVTSCEGLQWGREGRGLGERQLVVPVGAPGLFDLLTLAGRAGQAEEQFWLEELENRRISPLTPFSTSLSLLCC
jgi:hypothetical protein